jgi:uncharacterized protein DUF6666
MVRYSYYVLVPGGRPGWIQHALLAWIFPAFGIIVLYFILIVSKLPGGNGPSRNRSMNGYQVYRCAVVRWTWLPLFALGLSTVVLAQDSDQRQVHFQRPSSQNASRRTSNGQVVFRTPEVGESSRQTGPTNQEVQTHEGERGQVAQTSDAKQETVKKLQGRNPLRAEPNLDHNSKRKQRKEKPVSAVELEQDLQGGRIASKYRATEEVQGQAGESSHLHQVHRVHQDVQVREATFRRRIGDTCASCGMADECDCEPGCGIEEVSCGIAEPECGCSEPACGVAGSCDCIDPGCGLAEPECGLIEPGCGLDGLCDCGEPSCGICEPDCGAVACGSCVGRSGPDYWCFPVCLPRFKELTFWGGVHGFRGPRDFSSNLANTEGDANFGFQEGFNIGGRAPLIGLRFPQLGYQLGYQAMQSRLAGSTTGSDDRSQQFLTVGLFRRIPTGLQAGVAWDFMSDDLQTYSDFHQFRYEISLKSPHGRELGFMATTSTNSNAIEGEIYESVDQYLLFYRWRHRGGGESRLWAGGTNGSEGVLGAQFQIPLSDRWSLESGFNYLITDEPKGTEAVREESWNLGINLVWHMGRTARKGQSNPFRPLFNVVDNGWMFIDRRP